VIWSLILAWAFAVAVFDIRQRRIPNVLLVALAVPAVLALAVNRQGLLGAGIQDSLLGLLLGAAPLLAGYLMRQVGAGDVKLSGLQGLVLGVDGAGKALLVSGIVLGLMSALALLEKTTEKPRARLPAGVALVVGFVSVVLAVQLL
jgi:prepilin peptidase CpaA